MLGFIALGKRVVVVPSEAHPLSALDLAPVFDSSDLPGDGVNTVSAGANIGADVNALARTLASHFNVDAIWRQRARLAQQRAKRRAHASNVNNIGIPYGV